MSSKFTLPQQGFVFWPVGTGDSTTIVVKPDEVIVQIDLHHLEKSEDTDDPTWPIVDELVRLLPRKNGKPYLSVFMLTHPDEDHICGFAELLKKVVIGEIWHTPRIFRDYEDEETLCSDAEAFRKEVHRRREAIIANPDNVKSGDRVRVIGHDDILNEDKYKDFPRERTSIPGSLVTQLDDEDVSESFETFIHAPFKVDAADTRNNTSLSLQIVLKDGDQRGKGFFFGDREYPTIKQIFDVTIENGREEYLLWDVLLAPHHCSKKVMFWKEEGEDDESFKQDVMNYFETYAQDDAHIISSSNAEFTDEEGACPPHLKARKKYEEIVSAGNFLCTHEHPSDEECEPVVFEMTETGLKLRDCLEAENGQQNSALAASVITARGGSAPPQQQVGFGKTT